MCLHLPCLSMNYVDEKELLEYFKEEYNQEEVWLIILEWNSIGSQDPEMKPS